MKKDKGKSNTTSIHTVTVLEDTVGDYGASVYLDGQCVMSGAPDDFYPGCHGIYEYGDDWKGVEELVQRIKSHFKKVGQTVSVNRPECHYVPEEHEFILGPAPKTEIPAKETKKISALPKNTKRQLKELDKALSLASRIMENLDNDLGVDKAPEVEEAYEEFRDVMSWNFWRKYDKLQKALKERTDWENK